MSYSIVGSRTVRRDSPGKVTGSTRYAADINRPNMLQVKVLRSPFAHARILSIDTSKAAALPGVVVVLTANDLEMPEDPSSRTKVVFAKNEVLYHAQPVAAVAAESIDIAEAAIDLIDVVYEALPAAIDAVDALRDDAPLARLELTDEGEDREGHMTIDLGNMTSTPQDNRSNAASRLRFKRGDIAVGFAEADLIVEGRFDCAMVHQAPLEMQVAVAEVDNDNKLTVYSPTQGQFHQRDEIAATLGLPQSQVRLVSTEMGGGFGARVAPLIHPIVGLIALKTKRPAKLVLTRREELACGVPAQRTVTTIKLGAKNDGTLTTIQADIIMDSGAFPSGLGLASVMAAACYRYEHLDVDSVKVLTNKVSTGAYRAPGAPEVMFAVEQMVDEIARKLNMDPIDLRRKNAVREGDLMPNGKPWRRIGMIECLDALEASDFWQNRHKRANGRTHVGVALGAWLGGFQPATAICRLNEQGTISVIVGSNDISGTNTTFAMAAAETIGVSFDLVDCVTGDTDPAPFSGIVSGSKATYSFGPSVLAAAEDVKRQIVRIAAAELEAPVDRLVISGNEVRDPESGNSITLRRISGLSMSNGARYAPVLGRGGEVVSNVAPGFTAQGVELEVDEETGVVSLKNLVIVQDVGVAINPLSVEGQLEGGLVQGVAMGLTEEMTYDEFGRLKNGTLLDYRLLTSLDVPAIETILVQVPSEEGPFGARIVGEPPIVAGSSAVANALRGATGVRFTEAPITPERVVRGMRSHVQDAVPVG